MLSIFPNCCQQTQVKAKEREKGTRVRTFKRAQDDFNWREKKKFTRTHFVPSIPADKRQPRDLIEIRRKANPKIRRLRIRVK